MANNQRGNKRSYDQTLKHQPKKPPHFFKIIFSPVDRGVKIPYAFMRDYGENLGKEVVLKVPISGGASWPVELLRTEFGTWLDKGWKEFAEYYSIGLHYFLVFKYAGDSLFQVIIFDPSTSEIEYPLHDDQKSDDQVETGDDDSIEILQDFSAEIHEPEETPDHFREKENAVKKEISEEMPQYYWNAESKTVVHKDKFKSCQRAKAFTSKNPFFIKLMQPSLVTNSYTMGFSRDFAEKYLPKLEQFDMDLRVSEVTKTWPVTCYVYTSKAKIMSRGWKKFVLDNHLVVGDVCVFELIRHARMFKVTIYRRD